MYISGCTNHLKKLLYLVVLPIQILAGDQEKVAHKSDGSWDD